MSDNKKTYIALFGENIFECLGLILWAVLKRVKLIVITPPDISSYLTILKRIFFVRNRLKQTIEEHKAKTYLGHHKGLWHEVNKETIDLTQKFYTEQIKGKNTLIPYYNRILKTDKMDAYFKRWISKHIFALLHELHLIRLMHLDNREILAGRNPINKFVVEYMEKQYGVTYRKRWVLPVWRPLLLFAYYGWLFQEFIKRGVVINKKRESCRISKEANTGFVQKTHRDDMIIDNDKFKKHDFLLLQFDDKDRYRVMVFNEAKRRGYGTASLLSLKININKNIVNILFFYFWVPLKSYFQLLCAESYLFYYVFFFHKISFPAELLMNLYSLKCHISDDLSGDIAFTIILNKYGTKNVVYGYSDLSNYVEYQCGFIAHNVFYVWGRLHYNLYSATHAVDNVVNTGCIFKREFNKGVEKKLDIITRIPNFNKGKKVVTFFDDSCQGTYFSTEEFFMQYRRIMLEFCKRNQNVNVLLKPKGDEAWTLGSVKNNATQYKEVQKELMSLDNFYHLDPLLGAAEAIAISDVSMTMGLHTPSTIALICGKNGLYFDNSGNLDSPLVKRHKNVIVFDDEELLFTQINNILNGKFNCRDAISESEIREYDTFSDDNGVGRLRDHVYELTRRKK